MKLNRLLIIITVLLLMLSAFGAVSAQEGGAITVLYPQEFDSLNRMYSSQFFMVITQDLYLAPAWAFDQDLNPQPVLVTEIPSVANGGVSEDGLTITLKLRDDIVWSDGEPITASDFVFTYDMVIDPNNVPDSRYPYDPELGIITGVEAADDTTVVISFAEPFAPWLSLLFNFVLPEHVLRPVYEAEGTIDNADWNDAPTVSSGPFVFDEWEIGSFMRFVRNDNYYNGVANLDTVVISFIPEDEALINTLLNGDGDVATFIAYSDLAALEDAGFVPQIVASGYNEQWLFNLKEGIGHPALQDINVRKAISMAVNREQITTDLLEGRTYPAVSFWEGTPYANPDLEAPPYDPEAAKALLDEAGWVDSNGDGVRDKDGVELNLRYISNTRQIRVDTMAVFQQQLAEVGVAVELINYPSDIFFSSYLEGGPVSVGDYDIAEYSTNSAFPDPDTSQFLCSQIASDESPDGANDRGVCIPELDALFAAQSQETDPQARIDLFHQIDQLIHDQYIFLGIWYDPDVYVVSDRVQNTAINGVTPFWNAVEWSVSS